MHTAVHPELRHRTLLFEGNGPSQRSLVIRIKYSRRRVALTGEKSTKATGRVFEGLHRAIPNLVRPQSPKHAYSSSVGLGLELGAYKVGNERMCPEADYQWRLPASICIAVFLRLVSGMLAPCSLAAKA